MTWPTPDVNNANTSSGTTAGQPAAFRTDVRDLITKFNLLRNHVSTLMQGLLGQTTAAAACAAIGAAKSGVNTDITSIAGNAATATVANSVAGFSAFYAKRSVALTSGTDWVFDVVTQSGGTNYSTSTGVFTAPASGWYCFSVWGAIYNSTGGSISDTVQLLVGGVVIESFVTTTPNASTTQFRMAGSFYMTSGQTAKVTGGGFAATYPLPAASQSGFTGSYLGA